MITTLDRPNGTTREHTPGVSMDAAPGTYRAYVSQMERVFGPGNAPGLHDIMAGCFAFASCFDDRRRNHLYQAISRTGTEIQGSSGGFAVPTGISADIWDQVRTVIGPWSLCNWEPVVDLETWFPISSQASLAVGSQGVKATWGLGETSFPAPTDDRLARIQLKANRLLIQTQVSRDLASDAQRVLRWLKYRGFSAIRLAIELAMIYGSGTSGDGFPCPMGVLGSTCTTSFKRTSSSTIKAADIDGMHSQLYAGCMANAVWHCGSDAFNVIDQLAVSGQYPEILYARPGQAANGVFATMKGHPIVVLETSPPVGTAGDLILVDWSQYVLTYMQKDPRSSALAFDFAPPQDHYHQGMVGMPPEAMEARVSDEYLYSTDTLMINFKLRSDGVFLWPQPKTTSPGSLLVGPAVMLV